MIATLPLPDEVHQAYVKMNPVAPSKAMIRQLERFKDFGPTDRALVLSDEARRELEALHQTPFESEKELVEWVRRLTTLTVDEVKVQLSDGQRIRLQSQAAFYVRPYEQHVEKIVKDGLRAVIGG